MFVIFVTLISYVSGSISLIPYQNHHSSYLNSLLNSISQVKHIYTVNFNEMLEKPVIRTTGTNLVIFRLQRSDVIIINTSNGSDLEQILFDMSQNPVYNFRSHFIITTEQVKPVIFETLARFFISKVLVTNGEKIFTYKPYKYENVNTPSVDYFLWGKKRLPRFKLPSKWRNSTITALSNFVPPYSICHRCSENRGIEFDTFDIIADHLQLRVNYTRDSFDYWGSKSNGTYSHILGMLQRREGHLGIGVFHSKFEEHLDFDMSFTYMEDGTRWVVPKAKILPYWKRLGLIFTKEVYLSLFLSILLMTTICHVLYNTPYSENCVMLYQILLEYSIKQLPLTFRTIIIMWTCSCLILSTMFKSKLIDIMSKNSYDQQIDTLSDIVKSKLQILIDHDIARFYDYHTSFEEKYVKENYQYCINPRICINQTAFVQDCVTVDFQRSNQFFIPLHYVDDDGDVLLHLFKNYIFPVHIHLFFVKGYPIFTQIDQLLMRMRANGLVDHFYDMAGYKARMAMSRKSVFKVEVLGMEQLQVAFLIWSMGVFMAVGVFMLEVVLKGIPVSLTTTVFK